MRVFIGLGSNLEGKWGMPLETLERAVEALSQCNIGVLAVSLWYGTEAIGQQGQDNYLNGVVLLETSLSPHVLLRVLQRIEQSAGRQRGKVWAARCLDLDIVSYGRVVMGWRRPWVFSPHKRDGLVLPHPEAHKRPFVIRPLQDIAPDWKHPVLGCSAQQLWSRLKTQRQGRLVP